jgi:hypothetical protein
MLNKKISILSQHTSPVYSFLLLLMPSINKELKLPATSCGKSSIVKEDVYLYSLALLNAALRPFFEGFNWAR